MEVIVVKKFFLGTIFGALMFIFSINVFSDTFYTNFKIEPFNHPIYINSKEWERYSDCLLINDTTYVPLRIFCNEVELGLEWLDKKGNQPSQIRLTTPFLRTSEIISDVSAVNYEPDSFIGEIIEKIQSGDETAQKLELDTSDKAVKHISELCSREFGKNVYYRAPWTVYYINELWLVYTDLGRGDGEPFEVVVINKGGDVLFLRQYCDMKEYMGKTYEIKNMEK